MSSIILNIYILQSRELNDAFTSDSLNKMKMYLVIDEAHCILEWGDDFRPDFRKLSQLRSVFKCQVLALSATVTESGKKQIITSLLMKNCQIVCASPAKDNIVLIVRKRPSPNAKGRTASSPYDFIFHHTISELNTQLDTYPITVIYCKSMQWIGYGYEMARQLLGDNFYAGDKAPHNARVVMFHSSMDKGSGQLQPHPQVSLTTNPPSALVEKHYLTIHLPINKDCHLRSFSSLLYFNPDSFKDTTPVTLVVTPSAHGQTLTTPQSHNLAGSCSTPNLFGSSDTSGLDLHLVARTLEPLRRQRLVNSASAFDGYNMVPSLKPLETLHNTLTMRDMDSFLSRATTTKFFTPVSSPMYGGTTPLVSPKYQERVVRVKSSQSLPSSSNSSGGPSSPTSASTPIDFMQKLKMYILDSQKRMQETSSDIDPQSTNQQPALSANQVVGSQQLADSSNQTVQTSTNKNSSYPVSKSSSNQKVSALASRSDSTNRQSPVSTPQTSGQNQTGLIRQSSSKTAQDVVPDTKAGSSSNSAKAPAASLARPVVRPSEPRSPVFHVTHVPEDTLIRDASRPKDGAADTVAKADPSTLDDGPNANDV